MNIRERLKEEFKDWSIIEDDESLMFYWNDGCEITREES